MSRFPQNFLDNVRDRLPVSEVARRLLKTPLKKDGGEYKALSPFNAEKTPSFCVNDRKAFWHDFSSGKHGDIFGLEMELTGCDFPEAVERLAQQAGVAMPDAGKDKPNGQHRKGNRSTNGAAQHEAESGSPFDDAHDGSAEGVQGALAAPPPETKDAARRAAIKGPPTKVYQYTDAEGRVLYEKLRFEYIFRGEKAKTFVQRRELPNGDYAWGLDAGEYFRTRDGRWLTVKDTEHRGPTSFLPGVERVPYRLPELLNAIEVEDPVFAAEGEKDADTLADNGLAATCSVGGNWEELAGYFSRAKLIQCVDNDPAAEKYVQRLGLALREVVASHRVLRFPELERKGDVTRWFERPGNDVEKLFEKIAKEAEPWRPVIPPTNFGAVHFHQIGTKKPDRDWQIKNLLLRGAFGLVFGPPGCGKSFLVTDLLLTMAWAVVDPINAGEWFGHKIRVPTGVVYIASESPEDFEVRLHAWRERNELPADLELPFVFLPTTVDLATPQAETKKLADELKDIDGYFRAKFNVSLGVTTVDTVSRSLAGGNENAPDIMGGFVRNCESLRDAVSRMTVLGVHHSPLDGARPRGHTILHGAADLELEVRKATADQPNMWTVRKFKAGPEGLEHSFRLQPVQVSTDSEGEPITSCVIAARAASDANREAREKPKGQVRLRIAELEFLRALSTAIDRQGVAPPPKLAVPKNVELVVETTYVRDIYMEQMHATESGDETTVDNRLRQRWRAATRAMLKFSVIGSNKDCIWFTGRPVSGNVTIRGVRFTKTEETLTKSGKPLTDSPEPLTGLEEPLTNDAEPDLGI